METEGLDPNINAISQIGIRTNKGFEKIISIQGEGEEKLENEMKGLPTKETTVWTKENMSQEQIDYIEPCIAKTLYDLLYPSFSSHNTKEGYSQWLSNLLVDDDTFEFIWKWRE